MKRVPAHRGLNLWVAGLLCVSAAGLSAQQPAPAAPGQSLPAAPSAVQQASLSGSAGLTGTVTDTDQALISTAQIVLEETETKVTRSATSDASGSFSFVAVPPGKYMLRISAPGFSQWKVEDIILHADDALALPTVELGVEEITASVNAITQEDLAEQQISAEEHQRILGILPNFYVSYVSNAAPLTRKQKFKLAFVVSTDPLTFMTTGVTAGIEQAQGDFSGYGPGISGYAQRYAATYGNRLSATFLGSAFFPSIFHQDPRYFYRGHGRIVTRALYAISTTVICKGDNGHFQPNYSNVLGNLGAAFIAGTYYPRSDQHAVQVTVSDTLLGVAYGSFGTLFQEFLLRHVTHGAPPITPAQP
ncbi:carboxypeptidase-like regulatory domain-containing protein [Granulicella tundricola]|uniref:carboxypeptidase-like regulatory domain-containing protein n=1 Tax=Granulicella tundricola TaxID=940615 RepID=UPI0009FCA7A9|nr:carboxypeptidase-like regulatory domain-containing protein [Granulicella tundricola]